MKTALGVTKTEVMIMIATTKSNPHRIRANQAVASGRFHVVNPMLNPNHLMYIHLLVQSNIESSASAVDIQSENTHWYPMRHAFYLILSSMNQLWTWPVAQKTTLSKQNCSPPWRMSFLIQTTPQEMPTCSGKLKECGKWPVFRKPGEQYHVHPPTEGAMHTKFDEFTFDQPKRNTQCHTVLIYIAGSNPSSIPETSKSWSF